MSEAPSKPGETGGGPDPSSGLAGYRELLGPVDRRALFAAGVVARVPLAIVGYSVLFFVQAYSGSFATAGFASGLAIAAMAVVSPLFGRIADRRGQRGALIVAAVAHPVMVALLICLGAWRAPTALVCVVVVCVGGSIAPVGAFMRARWSGQLGVTPLLQVAFSLEAIADELVWVFGPALAALVAGTISPSAGLVLSALFGTAGAIWLLRGADVAVIPPPTSGPRHTFRPWRSRRLVGVLLANAAVGVIFGVNDVTVVSWTTSIGAPQIAGLVLTAYSIGSVTGGFLMGLVPGRIPAYRLFVVSSLALGVFWGALSLAPNPYWLFPIGLFAGATITPFTISTNRVVHDAVSPTVFTEALAWVSAFVVGAMAFGSFIGGVVDEAGLPDAGFGVVAALSPLPVVVALVAGVRWHRRRRVEGLPVGGS
ncbi:MULTISPECIES: MFS transporter [unclassified Frondihabitans]|uniref:MFS transporter n=1 Tax=unclassified Frondihabitans TaxID=2626248 RepID=UPI000F980576|nr:MULTISPECIES: MFS transporter [unclassified Frondihabitans]RPE77551.1 putative MFS family arabinose efflux permease [Frondihabitans sp. PhB153]RPF07828.1 putative MFS family arabinose efflux permease [Frondihabitans sp. PhB161]